MSFRSVVRTHRTDRINGGYQCRKIVAGIWATHAFSSEFIVNQRGSSYFPFLSCCAILWWIFQWRNSSLLIIDSRSTTSTSITTKKKMPSSAPIMSERWKVHRVNLLSPLNRFIIFSYLLNGYPPLPKLLSNKHRTMNDVSINENNKTRKSIHNSRFTFSACRNMEYMLSTWKFRIHDCVSSIVDCFPIVLSCTIQIPPSSPPFIWIVMGCEECRTIFLDWLLLERNDEISRKNRTELHILHFYDFKIIGVFEFWGQNCTSTSKNRQKALNFQPSTPEKSNLRDELNWISREFPIKLTSKTTKISSE